jgi:uncharacterized protein YecT (DUF1311 family)
MAAQQSDPNAFARVEIMREIFVKTLLALSAAVVLVAGSAQADEKINCKSGDLNQMQLDQCAGQDFTKSDGKLNAIYKDLMSRYDAANGALLKDAQRKWLAFRDSECSFETNGTVGGTINPMMDTMCRTRMTDARVKELNAQLHCQEGDMSCNLPVK